MSSDESPPPLALVPVDSNGHRWATAFAFAVFGAIAVRLAVLGREVFDAAGVFVPIREPDVLYHLKRVAAVAGGEPGLLWRDPSLNAPCDFLPPWPWAFDGALGLFVRVAGLLSPPGGRGRRLSVGLRGPSRLCRRQPDRPAARARWPGARGGRRARRRGGRHRRSRAGGGGRVRPAGQSGRRSGGARRRALGVDHRATPPASGGDRRAVRGLHRLPPTWLCSPASCRRPRGWSLLWVGRPGRPRPSSWRCAAVRRPFS
jgi:hypothetical protein